MKLSLAKNFAPRFFYFSVIFFRKQADILPQEAILILLILLIYKKRYFKKIQRIFDLTFNFLCYSDPSRWKQIKYAKRGSAKILVIQISSQKRRRIWKCPRLKIQRNLFLLSRMYFDAGEMVIGAGIDLVNRRKEARGHFWATPGIKVINKNIKCGGWQRGFLVAFWTFVCFETYFKFLKLVLNLDVCHIWKSLFSLQPFHLESVFHNHICS